MKTMVGLGLVDIAAKVDFSTEQVARMCAVSRRQLAYWAQKGIIPSQEGYSLTTVEKVLLIRREISKGATLRQAVQRVEERMAERARNDTAAMDLPAEQAGLLLTAQMDKAETILLSLREALPSLSAEEQQNLAARVAALGLENLIGSGISSMSPNKLAIQVNRAVEHLELVLDDVRGAV